MKNFSKLISIFIIITVLAGFSTLAFATNYSGSVVVPGLSGIKPGDTIVLPSNTGWATLTASWGVQVDFVDYDGTVLASAVVPEGGTTSAPEDPEREGYTFRGWIRTDGTDGISSLGASGTAYVTKGPGPIVYTAKYQDYSITVTNATPDHTYSAYKIFDATVNDDGDIAYYYDGTLPANDYFVQDEFGNVTATDEALDETTNTLTKEAIEFLGTLVDTDATPDASKKATGNTVLLELDDPGYYYVTSSLGTIVTIDSAKPDAKVIDKNQKPDWDNDIPGTPENPSGTPGVGKVIIESEPQCGQKEGDTHTHNSDCYKTTVNSAKYGETVNFDIGIKATNFDETELITYYYIKDTFGDGFTMPTNFDPVVKVDGVQLNKADDLDGLDGKTYVIYLNEGSDNTFEIILNWADVIDGELTWIYPNAAEIHVEYSAIVNTDAVIGEVGNVNTANFSYDTTFDDPLTPDVDESYDPENPPSEDMYPKDPQDPDNLPEYDDANKRTTTTYVYALGLEKVNGSGKALPGAHFKLADGIKLTGADGVYSYSDSGTADLDLVCDSNGKLLIKGLDAGTYVLNETKAPDGYNIKKDDITFELVLGEADFDDSTYAEAVAAATEFENNSGIELPSTGGSGTKTFIIIGAIVAVGAAIFLITNRRMSFDTED